MTLRRQLLLVSLLLLSLPWAGCQFLREMEETMRQGQENALLATARAIATVTASQAELLYPYPTRRDEAITDSDSESLYAFHSEQPVIVDGYGDGWGELRGSGFASTTGGALSLNVVAQTRRGQLYLLIKVSDSQVSYHHPGLSERNNGDRVLLRLGDMTGSEGSDGGTSRPPPADYLISTAAPGKVQARPLSRTARSNDAAEIRGFWQDAEGGYTLELALPLATTRGRLGIAILDDRSGSGEHTIVAGNFDPASGDPGPWLISSPQQLQELLSPFANDKGQVYVVDRFGWILAHSASGDTPIESPTPETDQTFWLLQWLYRNILSSDEWAEPPHSIIPGKLDGREVSLALGGQPGGVRYRDPLNSSLSIQSVAAPLMIDRNTAGDTSQRVAGAVVVRQSGENYLSLTDQAFSQLLGYSLAAMAIAAAGMLGYASLLSWRVRRLSQAVNSAIGEDGAVTSGFKHSRAGDEIGDLSRHYAALLKRVREYNDYLRSLSRKLSHELRTPIAVIQSSLDNLEYAADTSSEASNYRQRAREGLARLQKILTAMSEANQLEESIRGDSLETMDLLSLLSNVWPAYADVYPTLHFRDDLPSGEAPALLAPELLVQALDKLVDNAASFCPPGGEIALQLDSAHDRWVIRIVNDGPMLPPEIADHLFDPMVSQREPGAEQVHLGLGLHIVRLVTEFHGGVVSAANRTHNSGVVISLEVPKVG